MVDGGDHSLAVTATALKKAGQTQADVDALILNAVRAFLNRCQLGHGDPSERGVGRSCAHARSAIYFWLEA